MTGLEDSYPLSPIQEGMVFHCVQSPGSGVYVQQLVCELHEELVITAFIQAWNCLLARHAVLRTAFRWIDQGRPVQEVHGRVRLPVEQFDWRGLSGTAASVRQQEFLETDRARGFRLDEPPLLRLAVIRTSENTCRVVFTFHHALLDGRSCRTAAEICR